MAERKNGRRRLLLPLSLPTFIVIGCLAAAPIQRSVSAGTQNARPSICPAADAGETPVQLLFEGPARKAWEGDRYVRGVLLRLVNRSGCPIIIEAAPNQVTYLKVENFKFVRRAVGVIKDRQVIDLKYLMKYPGQEHLAMGGFGGDLLEYVRLDSGKSVMFGVPLNNFKRDGELRLPYRYQLNDVREGDGFNAADYGPEHIASFEPRLVPGKLLRKAHLK